MNRKRRSKICCLSGILLLILLLAGVDVYKRQVHNRVLFVERSGELRLLARLSTQGAEPKGNQVLRGRRVSKSRPETG